MKIRTVVIESNGAALVINESDFRHGSDKLWVAGKESEVKSTNDDHPADTKAAEDIENDVIVKHKGGGRWTVTVNGHPVHEGTLKKEEAKALAAEY